MKKIPFFSIVKHLLFYSLFVIMTGCSSAIPIVKRTTAAHPSDFVVWTSDFRSNELKNSYRITLTTPKNTITGLFFMKRDNNEWKGTLLHEMGAKAFDFRITEEACELLHVVPMMDKWYIKKTVAADLFFFIHVDNPAAPFYKRLERFEQNGVRVVNYKKKQVVVGADGSVRLINKSRKLQYELNKMVELDPDKMIL